MLFHYLLLIGALALASVAGFFSITGIGNIYEATFIQACIMGVFIEFGKLLAVSYLYREWLYSNILLKAALFLLLLITLTITSGGVYGYLSQDYTDNRLALDGVTTHRVELVDEKKHIEKRLKAIESDVTRTDGSFVTKRIELIGLYAPEREKLDTRLLEIRSELVNSNSKRIEVEKHTGIILSMAKQFGFASDNLLKWFTILITLVLDPFAIALLFAYNQAVMRKSGSKETSIAEALETTKGQLTEMKSKLTKATKLTATYKERNNTLKAKIRTPQ
jgi:hypothetical protein